MQDKQRSPTLAGMGQKQNVLNNLLDHEYSLSAVAGQEYPYLCACTVITGGRS